MHVGGFEHIPLGGRIQTPDRQLHNKIFWRFWEQVLSFRNMQWVQSYRACSSGTWCCRTQKLLDLSACPANLRLLICVAWHREMYPHTHDISNGGLWSKRGIKALKKELTAKASTGKDFPVATGVFVCERTFCRCVEF